MRRVMCLYISNDAKLKITKNDIIERAVLLISRLLCLLASPAILQDGVSDDDRDGFSDP
ncbi:hypothetical protein AVEN_81473-1, partial [Araneus ventricosus]